MDQLFSSGRLVDFVLIVVAVEAVTLCAYWIVAGKGVAPRDLLPNLLAGFFLVLALRLTLSDAGWMPVCGCLAAAGIASMMDISRRWRD
jgi:hypothetical protein